MNKIDRLLKSVEGKALAMEQKPVTLDHTAIGERVRPTYAHKPEQPAYIVIGKEFRPEIENGVLYNVAYYRLQRELSEELHHRLVASYEIVLA